VEAEPNNPKIHEEIGDLFRDNGMEDKAIKKYTKQ
jgi:hypothetical protein